MALVAAVVAGVLTATHWYESGGETVAVSLWTAHPPLAALIVAGAALVAGTSAASLFRVPSDEPNLPTVVLGFAMLAALMITVCCVLALANVLPPVAGLFALKDTPFAVVALLAGLVALGGTGAMVASGRQQVRQALAGGPEAHAPVARKTATTPTVRSDDAAARTVLQAAKYDADGDPLKRCPDCAEWVKDAARVCRYCGHRFAS